jgi:hypothetical protein
LEFESKQGWKPLCEFLGKEIPDEEYPHSSNATSTASFHGVLYWIRLVKVSFVLVSAITMLGFAIWKGLKMGKDICRDNLLSALG